MPASPPPRLRRQFTFLRQLAKEARHLQRQDLLRHANADQINAVSLIANHGTRMASSKTDFGNPGSPQNFLKKATRLVDESERRWLLAGTEQCFRWLLCSPFFIMIEFVFRPTFFEALNVRSLINRCRAWIRQRDNDFRQGLNEELFCCYPRP